MPYGKPKTLEEFLAEKYGEVPETPSMALEQPRGLAVVAPKPAPAKPEPAVVNQDEYPEYYKDADAMDRAGESSSKLKLYSAIGSGVQDFIKGATGFQGDDYFARLGDSANQPIAREESRQNKVREYLKHKYDSALKEKSYDLQLNELKNKNAYQNADLDLKRLELGIKSKKESRELPKSDEAAATTLGTKLANKVAITQQIDSYLEQMKDAPYDLKIALGNQMIKVLNSTEGQDAVGTSERESLAQKLKFVFLGNLNPFSDQTFQLGRDVPGFMEQARMTSDALKGASAGHKKTMEGITGTPSRINVPKPSSSEGKPMFDDPEKQKRYEDYKKTKGIQ